MLILAFFEVGLATAVLVIGSIVANPQSPQLRRWAASKNGETKNDRREVLRSKANPLKVGYIFLYFTVIVLILGGCSSNEPPVDNALIETFKNQQDKFEILTNMFLDDKDLEKVATYYVRPEDTSISEQRFQKYHELLKELNLHSIEGSNEAVFLTAYVSGGFPDDGVYKGYVYFSNGIPPRLEAPVIDDLDGLEWNSNHVTQFYRKIDEKWYLWFLA